MKEKLRIFIRGSILLLSAIFVFNLPTGFAKEKTRNSQDIVVSGKVTSDEDSQGLPGVSIIVKGSTKGTTTDIDGNYSLQVSEGATLQYSYIGYVTQEVIVNNQTVIDITLQLDPQQLEEVVVIGYGTAKKSDLTGSVVSVKSRDLTDRPLPSVAQALQGKAPGVLVRTSSAAPGGNVSIVIRGQNSVNSGGDPLYVVDGIPLADISTIPTEDIESVEVLKDASSTAIYGSRGANGVVLITTKSGSRNSTPTITYSNRFTAETIPTSLNLMNAEEFATFYTNWELTTTPDLDPANVLYNGSSADRPLPSEAGEGTDWFDEISQTGFIQNHTLSISGGGEKNKYALSASYLNQRGALIAGEYERFVVKATNTSDLTNWLEAGLNVNVSKDRTAQAGNNTTLDSQGGLIAQALKMSPAQQVFNEDGTYQANNFSGSTSLENPIAEALEVEDFNRMNRVFGNIFINFKPIQDLNFKVSLGGDIRDVKNYFYNPTTTIYGGLAGGISRLSGTTNEYFINEYILSYKKEVGKHSFDAVGGFTYEQNILESWNSGQVSGFFSDAFLYNELEGGSVFNNPESQKAKWSLASGLGRLNYIFNDKYLFTATGRYDGSSRFGINNKWVFFPSVAAAWNLSNEPFMKSLSNTISYMKVRTSWGETGNQNIGLYQSLSRFALANYPFGTTIQSGVAATSLQNDDLRWETTRTINLALDFTLWNKLEFTVEYYDKKTRDLLMNVALVETTGFSSALMNVGKMENKGMEFMLNVPILENDFRWDANFAVWFNRNKITELNGDATQDWKIGNPIGTQRGHLYDGIIRTQEELDAYVNEDGNPISGAQLGDGRRVDINGDGIINNDDLVIVFNPEPDFAFSFNQSLKWKNFGLDLFFYGTVGNQISNQTQRNLINTSVIRNNMSRDLLSIENGQTTINYWTPESVEAEFPRLGSGLLEPTIEDGSFLRLQNVMFTYNIPSKKFFKNASVYVSAQNLFTLTNYSGWDPDVNSVSGNQNVGIDRAAYPIPRSYTAGLNISF